MANYTGSAKYLFLENALKKIQSLRLIMEYNLIQMAASAGHAVVHPIGPIFKRQLSLACRRNTYL